MDFYDINDIELDNMRHQINRMYPAASISRQAILLSNQLWQRITPIFEHYSDQEKRTITLELFQRTLIANKPITANDIKSIYQQYQIELSIESIPTEVENKPLEMKSSHKTKEFLRYLSSVAILFLCVLCMFKLVHLFTPLIQTPKVYPISFKQFQQFSQISATEFSLYDRALPEIKPFAYTPLAYDRVENTLIRYNSELLNKDYLEILDTICKEENLNPALLLSIIGQEQGFIPQSHPYKYQIVNNPYNLYGSWEKKQISFSESTRITCKMLKRLLNESPSDVNPFLWINQTYAEDEAWYLGVEFFYTLFTSQS